MSQPYPETTIVAPATPPGVGGVAMVRVSGPLARQWAATWFARPLAPRHATFAPFCNREGDVVDEGLWTFFPAPRSYTGEDVLEFQCHGSPVVVQDVVAHCMAMGAVMAAPGEFTQRAFLNNKMDLVQAEAVVDLIHAQTTRAARSAMQSLQGAFSEQVDGLVQGLVELRAYVEAAIDFATEDIDFLADDAVVNRLEGLVERLVAVLNDARRGQRLRQGATLAIVGPPNAGKSSLMNAWTGRETAIVTAAAGTTRDVLVADITLDGLPVHLVDTAGLRVQSDDPIEMEGMRRAKLAVQTADVVVCLMDASQHTHDDAERFWQEHFGQEQPSGHRVMAFNKTDLHPAPEGAVGVAVAAGSLRSLETEVLSTLAFDPSADVCMARQRHVDALQQVLEVLEPACEGFKVHRAGELLAEDCRLAQEVLSTLTGKVTTEDLLGTIFSSFCIGK